MSISGFKYKPATIVIDSGDRVVWSNLDAVKHTATRGGSFTTGKIKPGKAVAVKFGSKGTYRYICTIHPDEMSGKVVVELGAQVAFRQGNLCGCPCLCKIP